MIEGVFSSEDLTTPITSIKVGQGGEEGYSQSKPTGDNGGDTIFANLTAYGGGGGGGWIYPGKDGGSGGGGGSNGNRPGGDGVDGQGFGGGLGAN